MTQPNDVLEAMAREDKKHARGSFQSTDHVRRHRMEHMRRVLRTALAEVSLEYVHPQAVDRDVDKIMAWDRLLAAAYETEEADD